MQCPCLPLSSCIFRFLTIPLKMLIMPGFCCLQGNGGYSSGDDSPSRQTSSSYSRPSMPQDSQRPHLTSAPIYSPAHPSGRVGSGAGDESHLVDDMCTPGGLRAQPDREDLRLFVENAASSNGTTVAELLQAKMVSIQVILHVGG